MVRSVSISGVLTLDLHSLSNEGTEGNRQLTRQVQVALEDGSFHTVNAISGDMLKHAQCEYFREVADEANLPLCHPARRSDANRINADESFRDWLVEKTGKKARELEQKWSISSKGNGKFARPASEVLGEIMKRCALTDVEGTLLVQYGYSVPRKSCVEFGWVVGRPGHTRTDSYVHVKYDPEFRGASAGEESGLGQALFYRPASSGQYAAVVHLELDRVGRNDVTFEYAVAEDDRRQRIKALLQSVTYTFVRPRGAHRNTQLPHVLGFQGIIATSSGAPPAPSASALVDSYRERVEATTKELNTLGRNEVVKSKRFDTMDAFVSEMHRITASLGA
ncbi:MAG: DevR family CRISPR-associated autoregulator [bacterium]|nr:DevR family CRISPR-associated autoregulator [bacterium]